MKFKTILYLIEFCKECPFCDGNKIGKRAHCDHETIDYKAVNPQEAPPSWCPLDDIPKQGGIYIEI